MRSSPATASRRPSTAARRLACGRWRRATPRAATTPWRSPGRPRTQDPPARARVAAAGGGAFVLVTAAAPATDAAADESAGAALYVAHVDAETNKIDHVAPFAVSQPVLSLAALDADLTDDANDAEADAEPAGFEIQLFCVQTRAIQQYFLRPSALYPATTAPATTAPATAAAAAPATEDPPARQRATGRPLAVIF